MSTATSRVGRLRSIGAAIALILAVLLLPVAVLGNWVDNTISDTDRYVATVGPLAEDPAIQEVAATRLTDAVMGVIDEQRVLGDLVDQVAANRNLPPRLVELIELGLGWLRTQVEERLSAAAHRFVATDAFAEGWRTANETAHVELVELTLNALQAEGDRVRVVDPPGVVPGREVLVLQPSGQLFFASAPAFERLLPVVTPASHQAVVVLRLRGIDHVGLSVVEVLRRFHRSLLAEQGTLKLVVGNDTVHQQLEASGLLAEVGADHVYRGGEWLGETVRRARQDGLRQLQGPTA